MKKNFLITLNIIEICINRNKNERTTPCIIHCLCRLTYENPRGFSIRFVFAKLVAEIRNEIIHKTVTHKLKTNRIF
jgi:hypothetical protein